MRISKVFIIETDIIVATIDPTDPHHMESRRIIANTGKCMLSPYTLIELDLLIRSGNIVVKDYEGFWYGLKKIMNRYNIAIIIPDPLHHAEAEKLRKTYGLTYFDSLHASVALLEKKPIVSYDERAYSKINGLEYIHPQRIVS